MIRDPDAWRPRRGAALGIAGERPAADDGAIFPSGARGAAAAGLLVLIAWAGWFEVAKDDLTAVLGSQASPGAMATASALGLATRIGSEVLEAGFYVAVWRLFGRRIRFGQLFAGIALLSTLDAIANVLARGAADAGVAPAWLTLLVGIRVLPDALSGEPGLRVAFGGFGALALLRLAGTAWLQTRDRVPWQAALGLTGAAWLAGRLATWWTTDLARGLSPVP